MSEAALSQSAFDPVVSVPDCRPLLGGLSRRTIYRKVKEGKLRLTRLSAGRVGIRHSELARYLDEMNKP